MAPRKATAAHSASVDSTYIEGYYEFYDPNCAQSAVKNVEWVGGASKEQLHTELLKTQNENADLQRQVKTYLKELAVANDKITARDVELAQLKSNIATLKKAPSANTTHDNSCALNEKMFSQICDGVESQLAVYRQQFEILQVKYKALEKYKEVTEAKNSKKGKNGQQPKKGKKAMKVVEIPEATTSMQGVDAMELELSNDNEVQQVQKENESESEQSSTSSEET
jgi:hypothetical protein